MKRLTMLAVALVMVLGMAVNASAAPEVTISGNILMNAVWKDNWALTGDSAASMELYQRSDLYFTITASENLRGVLGLRSIRGEWGQNQAALGNPGGGDWTLGIRDAFVEFDVPSTEVTVKAGVYNIALPQAVGGSSFILGDRAGAVQVSSAITENVSVLAGYHRLFDADANLDTTDIDLQNNGDAYVDAWLAAVPVSLEGFAFTPYLLYAYGGEEHDVASGLGGDDASGYWIGSDFTMTMFDPFVLKADLLYNSFESEDDTVDASGWLFALGLDYTGFDFMNVETYFVYTTGEDDDADESERVVPLAEDFALGSFFFGGGGITGDDIGAHPVGFWTLGASLTGIQSFAEGLTHDFHILYVQGTNDEDAVIAGGNTIADLTEDDSLFELDFNTAYAIYPELTLYAQLGYISTDFDNVTVTDDDDEQAYKVATGIVYQF